MKRFKLLNWFILRDRDLYRLLDKSYSDGFTNGCAAHIPKTLAGITFSKCPSVLSEVEEILRDKEN